MGWFVRERFRGLEEGLDTWMNSRAAARRRPSHSNTEPHWLTEDERALLAALSTLIVPSDEMGPGASEAKVVETLDRRIASSPSRQGLYARGLAGFDRLSRKRHGLRFAELTAPQQTDLLREIDRLSDAKTDSISVVERRAGRLLRLYRIVRHPAVQLFPVLVKDVVQAFYTSPVSWEWLGYDGPPMPLGYLDVVQPRA